MAASQEDFLFAEHVLRRGFATEEQVQECLKILDKIKDEMQLEETLAAILFKRGYIAKAQAHAVESAIHPQKREAANQIEGYRLLARIGAGAMGSVYKAEHLKLHIPVALKVLRVDLASSPTQVERLKREAQLAAQLDHPNVVRSLDVGESNGFHYFAMEYVEGTTVREAMRRRPLKEKDAIRIVRDVARALEHAHARGIIHRDVKPGNVMLTPDGTVKLTDLGLARGQEPSELTLDHAAIGTPHYIAPEQARRGADATTKSDLFSLGASLYHIVTGKPPFYGENLGEIFQRVLSCNFDPPESLVPDLSIDTTYVIHRLMRGNPRERYASATELIADLDVILDGKRVAPPDFRGDYRRFLERRRRRRIATISVGGGVLVAVTVVLALWYRGKEAERVRAEACLAANENTLGVATVGDARTMKSKLDEAEATLADSTEDCKKEELSELSERVREIRHQAVTLEEAEKLERASAKPKAEFRRLAATLDRLSRNSALYDGVRIALTTIGTKIRVRSDGAWKRDRSQVYGEQAWDVGMGQEAWEELVRLTKDLDERYVAFESDERRGVFNDKKELKKLIEGWNDAENSEAARQYAQALKLNRPDYGSAKIHLDALLAEKREARDNARLSRAFLLLFPEKDPRPNQLERDERKEWLRVERAAKKKRIDRRLTDLGTFRARAHSTKKSVDRAIANAEKEETRVLKEQQETLDELERSVRGRWKDRAYTDAANAVRAKRVETDWLPKVEERVTDLEARCRALEAIPNRFLNQVRGKASLTLKLVGKESIDVKGAKVVADGPERFRITERKGSDRIFTLGELDETREFLDLLGLDKPSDRRLRGYLYVAESYRQVDPREARYCLKHAVAALTGVVKLGDLQRDLEAKQAEVAQREVRAKEAYDAMLEADKKKLYIHAYEHGAKLLDKSQLFYTDFVQDRTRLRQIQKKIADFKRRNEGDLRRVGFALPGSNFDYAPEAGTAELRFTFERWYPDPAPADVADPKKWQEDKARKFWKGLGVDAERAIQQLRRWSGNVHVEKDELVMDGPVLQNYRLRKEGKADAIEPIQLANPFRLDRDWSLEFTVRWPDTAAILKDGEVVQQTVAPPYFVVAVGPVQAGVISAKSARPGAGYGTKLFVHDDLLGEVEKTLGDFHEHLVEDKKKREETSLFFFKPGKTYRVRLERRRGKVFFYAAEAAAWKGAREEAKAERRAPRAGRRDQARDFRILSLVRCRIADVVVEGTLTDE